jgi:hypothetical protein
MTAPTAGVWYPDRTDAAGLVAELGCHALAVDVAGHYDQASRILVLARILLRGIAQGHQPRAVRSWS